MAKAPPTELQVEVLKWIADGCPPGAMTDPKFKVSVYALERRDLVRVKRKRNPWVVEITDAGKQFLAKREDVSSMPVTVPSVRAKSATQQMVDRLMVQDTIEFARAETGRYRQLATVARRKNLLPEDMELVVTTSWKEPCSIALKRRPEWQLVVLAPIDVPPVVRTPYPVVVELMEQRQDRLGMDRPRWRWTLRLIQGLTTEVERRGYAVTAVPEPKPDYWGRISREEQKNGQVKVSRLDHEVHLSFSRAAETDKHVKEEFLIIRLTGLEPPFWQSEWTETEASPADLLLPRILQEIELRVERAVEQRKAKRRREDEKRRQWEHVRKQAIERLNEDHRAAVLLDQADRFQKVKVLTEYIAAMRRRIESTNHTEAAASNDWVQWAEAHVRAINPLLGELRMPQDPKPDAEAIKPYMNGWSPYGPERTLWH